MKRRSAESEEKRQAHQVAAARMRQRWHAEGYDPRLHLQLAVPGDGDIAVLFELSRAVLAPRCLADALAWNDLTELESQLRWHTRARAELRQATAS